MMIFLGFYIVFVFFPQFSEYLLFDMSAKFTEHLGNITYARCEMKNRFFSGLLTSRTCGV